MDASLIQARAATLRKTGNRTALTSPTGPANTSPPAPLPKPVAPKPRPKPSHQASFDDHHHDTNSNTGFPQVSLRQRSQTLKFDKKSYNMPPQVPQPYESSIPPHASYNKPVSTRNSVSSVPDNYTPEDAYDDIETVKEQMQKYKESISQPPPLPPLNTRSKSIDSMQPLLKRPAISPASTSLHDQMSNRISSSSSNHSISSLKESSSMTLHDLATKYRDQFPLQIKVVQGTRKSTTFSKGDVYDVHFIKTTDVVKIVTANNTTLFVPLNSALLFGAIYDPNNCEGPISGYLFNTVNELISCSSLPPLIYAQRTFETSSIDTSVQAGEVLVVKDINRQRFRSKSLTCTSISTNQQKQLFGNCEGSFSTAPHDVKLYLPNIVHHVPLPLKGILLYEGLNAQDVLPQLPNGAVTLTEVQKVESLLVTRSSTTGYTKPSNETLMELQLDTDILVEIMNLPQLQMDTLQERSLMLYDSFSPALTDYTSLLTSNNSYHLQKQAVLLSTIRYDKYATYGTTIKLSSLLAIRKSQNSNLAPQKVDEFDDEDAYQFPDQVIAEANAVKMKLQHQQSNVILESDCEYDIPQITPSQQIATNVIEEETYDIPRSTSAILTPNITPSDPVKKELGDLKSYTKPSDSATTELSHLQSQIDFLKVENNSLKMTVDILQKMTEGILKKTEQIQQEVLLLQQASVGRKNAAQEELANTEENPEMNRRLLYSLNFEQVQILLKEMHMQEYMQVFFSNQIDGKILYSMNESSLNQIGINSRLHKIKLLNIINGKISTRPYIEKDPYVRCFKK